ncbi:MAG: hypothetical protein ACR2P6_10470, partial [Gammaproteobacteria bacterium]
MSETLIVRLRDGDVSNIEWIVVDMASGHLGICHTGTFDELGAYADGRRIVVLAPAACVRRLNTNIPLRGKGKILQALP